MLLKFITFLQLEPNAFIYDKTPLFINIEIANICFLRELKASNLNSIFRY